MSMEPRKESSNLKKATTLPPDLLKMISDEIASQHEAFLKDKKVIVEGLIFAEEICLSVGFKEKDSIRQLNFQASIEFKPENPDPTSEESSQTVDAIHICADAIDIMMSEYIAAEGDISMPLAWTPYDFNGKTVFLRQSNENSEIEKMTREFLEQFPEESGFDPESPVH